MKHAIKAASIWLGTILTLTLPVCWFAEAMEEKPNKGKER